MTMRVVIAAGVLLLPAVVFADGAELYSNFCKSCHGENAEVLRSFAGTSDRFREVLEGDTQNMPDFYGIFSSEQVAELYQYVISIARGR